jgi:hypothetical protein
LWAWLILLPLTGFFPQISHIFAIEFPLFQILLTKYRKKSALPQLKIVKQKSNSPRMPHEPEVLTHFTTGGVFSLVGRSPSGSRW